MGSRERVTGAACGEGAGGEDDDPEVPPAAGESSGGSSTGGIVHGVSRGVVTERCLSQQMVCRPGKPPLVVAKSRAFARRCEELRKKMHMSLTDGDKLREREKKCTRPPVMMTERRMVTARVCNRWCVLGTLG